MRMKAINQYISVCNEASQESGELHVEGYITDSAWWDDEVSPKIISDSLKELGKVKNLDVYVNSYGGSCIAGNSIVSIIDDYKKKNNCNVNVYIQGVAASMGSGIAMAGDKVYMAENALFMVHKPLCSAYGNSEDLEKMITLLDKTEKTLVSNYMRKFNGTEDELKQLMSEETWMTADEAMDYGFVDEITDEIEIAACADGIRINNKNFKDKKVADMIHKKVPNAKIEEKEVKTLNYDEKLKEFGIDEEAFNTFGIESDELLNIANVVKGSVEPENVEQFVDKNSVCEALGVEDITAEELIDFAKAGKNPVEPDKEISNKANAYDKIVKSEIEKAVKNAVRAQGEDFNEERTRKMLSVLDYTDIVEQSEAWNKQAKVLLNAGGVVSNTSEKISQNKDGDYEINPKDCMI